jgi:hypothetical protein
MPVGENGGGGVGEGRRDETRRRKELTTEGEVERLVPYPIVTSHSWWSLSCHYTIPHILAPPGTASLTRSWHLAEEKAY